MDVCVIGGSRYFGKRLIDRLLAADARVTVVNRGSTPPPAGATRLVADRSDEGRLLTALGDRTFDVVVDQVCYTPTQAAVAASVFADRTARYVMTSTVEVYAGVARPVAGAALSESSVSLDPSIVDFSAPWRDEDYLEAHYGEAKRQAEAVFTARAPFDFVSVRSAHVLGGGAEDFTGRLAHYVDRVRAGEPIDVHAAEFAATFINVDEIAEFLAWAAFADFTGPVNAASHGELTARRLAASIPSDNPPRFRDVAPDAAASPFSFPTYYAMDNSRAERLGFGFSQLTDWLPDAIGELSHER